MGFSRKCKERSLHTLNSSKNNTAHNVRKKKANCLEDMEIESDQTVKTQEKTPSNNISIFNYVNNISYGDCTKPVKKNFHKDIINHLTEPEAFKTVLPFERRVTAVEWHPKYPKIFAAASKGGEILLLNLLSSTSSFIPGIGAGGSVVGLKFTLEDQCSVYTASITGKIRQESFLNETSKTLLSSNCFRNWFTSLDVSQDKKLILTGDCNGNGMLLTTDNSEKVWPEFKRLHKDKVSHVEFSLLDPNIFVTASIDHSAKIWDLRMMSVSADKPNPLRTFDHMKGVNSAYFSPSNRNSLLTTDQYSEIRVYKSPGWTEELVIRHPHRQFQHITPIKATWHPLEDIIIIGRYPHDSFKKTDTRSVDYFDGSNGDLLHRIRSVTGGIMTLNAFNITGDYLASASGCSISFKTGKDMLNNFPVLTHI